MLISYLFLIDNRIKRVYALHRLAVRSPLTIFSFYSCRDLEKQVETGQMRLVEEKRALSEISDLRRSRKAFDTFSTSQDSIDSDKAKIDELKTKLDNPEYKSLQGRYEEITKELEELNAELDKNGQSRDKLFDERNKLQEEVNKLWSRKKESAASFKDANDKYCEFGDVAFILIGC